MILTQVISIWEFNIWAWFGITEMRCTWYCTECWRTFLYTGDTQLSPGFRVLTPKLGTLREKRLRKVTLLHSWRQVKQNLCRQEFVMLLFSTWGVQVVEFKQVPVLPLPDRWDKWIPQVKQAGHQGILTFVSFCVRNIIQRLHKTSSLPDLTTGGWRGWCAKPLR